MISPRFLCVSLLAATGTVLWASSDLIPDDKFADDGALWSLKTAAEATASQSVVEEGGEKSLCIEVQAPAGDLETPPDVRVQRLFGEMVAGKNYQVSFQARAAEPAKIISYVYPENQGARVLWRTEIALDSEWKEFSYTFEGRDTAENCVLGFSNLGRMGNKYFIKDVVLTVD